MYIRTYVQLLYICMHTYIRIYACVWKFVRTYVHMFKLCMYVHTNTSLLTAGTHVYVCTYVCLLCMWIIFSCHSKLPIVVIS